MNKKFKGIFASALIFSMISTGCSDKKSEQSTESSEEISVSSSKLESSESSSSEIESTSKSSEEMQTVPLSNTKGTYISDITDIFSNNDLNPTYQADNEVILNGKSAEINGNGASVSDSVVTITEGGTYRISGTLDDGQIIVNSLEKVWLILDGADIHCSDSAPIYIQQSDKTFITLAENSENNLSDGSEYVYASAEENEPDAVIFSKDNLTVNGTGTLNISANFNEGITSKDDITITGGNINITSVGNGIKGKDCIAVTSANIDITAKADGMKSSNIDEVGKGFIFINDGNINIKSDEDALQAEQELIISSGTITTVSGDGCQSDNVKTHTDSMMMGGGHGGFFGMNESTEVTSEENFISMKSLKAGSLIYINGGNISVDSADDALHTNGTIVIDDGTINITSGDDGIHADTKLSINNGKINIETAYEGIESAVIDITGGETSLYAKDDGFNASDGSSQGAMGQHTNGVSLTISGGIVYANAGGDGLDSNGVMNISGGTVIVDGPTNSGNGALDSNGSISIDGGTLIAVGSAGMAEYPSTDSPQQTLGIIVNNQQGGTAFTICDSSNKEIITYKPSKSYSSIVISTPDLSTDETYTLYIGATSSAEQKYNLYQTGGYNNDGTEYGTYNTGEYSSGGMMGGFDGGGHGGHGYGQQMPPDEIPSDFNPENMTPPNGEIPEMPEDFDFGNMIPPNGEIPQMFEIPTTENSFT